MSIDTISTSIEKGFKFSVTNTNVITSIQIRLLSFERISAGRTLTMKIRNGLGVNGTIIYSNTYVISNSTVPIDTTLSISSGPTLTSSTDYTITFIDTTSGGSTTGFVYFYGIPQDVNFSSYNTNIYPKLNITINPSDVNFIQPSAQIATSAISTTLEQGFTITPSITGRFNSVSIRLSSFETVGVGRNITIQIRTGSGVGGTIVYTNNTVYTNNNLVPGDYSFSFTDGPVLTASTVYTITIRDTTSGGYTTGIALVYGIYGNNTFITTNIAVYPYLSVYSGNVGLIFSQSLNPTISDIVSTTLEEGFRFVPNFSGLLTKISLNLSSFGALIGRTLRVRIRDGSGLSGTILYNSTYVIANTSNVISYDIIIDPSLAPIITNNNPYTLTLIDISSGGSSTGSINIFGINSNSTYISYNTSVYPLMKISNPSFVLSISPPQDFAGFLNNNTDNIEFNTQTFENATTLFFNGLPSSKTSYFKVNLKYLVVPNQLLNVSGGGRLDNYPYIYLQILNEGSPGNIKTFISNNYNSILATFKIPIDKYLYRNPTYFFTLNALPQEPQILLIRPDQDIRIRLTLPDGNILSNLKPDNLSPLYPNPLLQISALFSISSL